MFPLPSTILEYMRAQANAFMTEPVEVYSITVNLNGDGQQIYSSGLKYTTSGYVGGISGRDKELLERLKLLGVETEHRVLVLLPIGQPIDKDDVVRTATRELRVIWSNKDTQDTVQLYQKAVCADLSIEPEKRFNNG